MALFTITQAAIDAGGLDNTATFTGTSPDGTTVNDVSDDGDPNDGGVDDVTEFVIAPAPAIQVVKTAQTTDNNNDNLIGGDDVITYTITITNTGNVSLSDLDLTDTLRMKMEIPFPTITQMIRSLAPHQLQMQTQQHWKSEKPKRIQLPTQFQKLQQVLEVLSILHLPKQKPWKHNF